MSRVVGALVGLVVGLVLGFWFGSSASEDPASVGAAARDARPSLPETPPPLNAAPPIDADDANRAESASKPAAAPQAAARVEATSATPDDELPTAEIRGTVTRTSGEPAAEAIVTCRRTDAHAPNSTELMMSGDELALPDGARVRTTKSGRFAIVGLTPGASYRLVARGGAKLDYNFADQQSDDVGVTATAPSAQIALPLNQPTLALEFVVPPDRLRGSPGEEWFEAEQFEIGSDRTTHSTGGILRTRLFVGVDPDQPIHIACRANGLMPVEMRDLKLARGESQRVVRLEMPQWNGNEVVFRVTDDRGAAVPRACMRIAESLDKAELADPWIEARGGDADESGEIRRRNVPPGMHAFVISAPSSLALIPEVVTLEVPRTGDVSRDVRLAHGAHVRLKVADGAPPPRVSLYQGSRVAPDAMRPCRLISNGETSASSNRTLDAGTVYELDRGLQPGPWLFAFTGERREPLGERAFVAVAGETVDLEYTGQ